MAVIRGRVSEVTFEGAEAHIDKLAKKNLGQNKYQRRVPGEAGPHQDRAYPRRGPVRQQPALEGLGSADEVGGA
jgi:hypothetical protein